MLAGIATEARSVARRTRLDRDAQLWLAAVLLFGVGDLATTIYFLSAGLNVEGNPLAVAVLQHGYLWLVVWKVGVFAGFWLLYRHAPREIRIGVPLGLTLLGAVITAWNIYSSITGTTIVV